MARTSFSIWAHQRSISVIERETYTTGFHSDLAFCSSTPQSPRLIHLLTLLWFFFYCRAINSVIGLLSSAFTCKKVSSWWCPQNHTLSLWRSSLNGWVNWARLGMNLPSWICVTLVMQWWVLLFWLPRSSRGLPGYLSGQSGDLGTWRKFS